MFDFSDIFLWWFTIFALGLVFLPVTTSIFKRFLDKGYIFSKVIGILFSSYTIWLLASLHILSFTRLAVILIILAFALINFWFFQGTKNSFKKRHYFLFAVEEIFFLGILVLWCFIRGNEPSIHGLEKFMDFGFMNSILRSTYFPPLDMWLAKSDSYPGGQFINYYYYGHYVAAYLTKLTNLNSGSTYNLMLETIAAFTFTLPFSIILNLYYFLKTYSKRVFSKSFVIKGILLGVLTGYMVCMGGNLHTMYAFTEGYPNEDPVPPWTLKWEYHPEKYWYPNATRFIPFTIHEFPIYSFVVSDLHGHVSDIPFVLLIIALLLNITITYTQPKKEENQTGVDEKKQGLGSSVSKFLAEYESRNNVSLPQTALLGLILAVMYMTNAWDGLIYMVLCTMVFLYVNIVKENVTAWKNLWNALYKTISACLFLFFFFLLCNLPFALNFKPFVSGVGALCAPSFLIGKSIGPLSFEADKCQKSPIYMLVILYGFFYFNVFAFLIATVLPKIKNFWKNKHLENFKQNFKQKMPAINLPSLYTTDYFVLILILLSTLLLIFPEFFFIKDIYPAHYRANTMFKLGYQAFMILGIVSFYAFVRIRQSQKEKPTLLAALYFPVFALLFALVAIYPYFAINSYYGNLQNYKGMDGLKWMEAQYLDDYKAILWINKNITCNNIDCNNQPVIAEANGDSYTDYARVSAYTGLPTIVGWPVHEWLWRGSYDEAGKRIPEVQSIYESKDLEATKQILKKYNVSYIFVGNLEREKYKDINEEKFPSLGEEVFSSGDTKIYKVSN